MTAGGSAVTPSVQGRSNGATRRPVWVRSAASPEDRRRVLAALFPSSRERWWPRFALMMGLSVVIAVMGLSGDSAAVVIGAMLIAPLMTPVMGVAAALVVALGRHAARAGTTVVLASVGAIGLAWGIGLALPGSERTLTHEALTRTSPDVRDLLVALAAGTAGAYATVRDDVSAALPGVAVAVALVPPLATVGYTLAAHRPDLASGALLLYAANLFAIILASVVVFLVTGLSPQRRLAERSRWILAGVAAVVVAVALVAVPLIHRSAAAIRHAHRLQEINTAVAAWLDATTLTLNAVHVSGAQVTVDLTGSQPPPASEPLRQALVAYLGPDAVVRAQWFQTSSPTTTKAPTSSPTTTTPATISELRPLVQAWLATSSAGAEAFEILGITVDHGQVTVDVAGPVAPPPADTLAQRVTATLGAAEQVQVEWTETHTLSPTTSTTTVDRQTRVHDAVQTWLDAHPDLELLAVNITDTSVTIDLAGGQAPNSTDLIASLRATAGVADIEIRFAPLEVLTPAASPRPFRGW